MTLRRRMRRHLPSSLNRTNENGGGLSTAATLIRNAPAGLTDALRMRVAAVSPAGAPRTRLWGWTLGSRPLPNILAWLITSAVVRGCGGSLYRPTLRRNLDMELFDLSGRVAVVTGGNGGIGLG